MLDLKFELPKISDAEMTPLVQQLLGLILRLMNMVKALLEEIVRLKEYKGKPRLKPSKMDKNAQGKGKGETVPKAKRGPRRAKTEHLRIDDEVVIRPEGLPENPDEQGWSLKSYSDFVQQELIIKTRNTRFVLEEWEGPDGQRLRGQLPASVKGHFGPELVSYVLHQYHSQGVTQPLLLEELHEYGVEISAGQLNNLLIKGKEGFHEEKAQVLEAGLQVSHYIQTDDTGARHMGKNGYCTFIGNDFFSWFESTQSKSRVNFLNLLRAGHTDYVLNTGALDYMAKNKLPQAKLQCLEEGRSFGDEKAWDDYLKGVGITSPRHVRIATEGALIGSLLARGFPIDMGVVSDDAGQFNVFRHVLCWIHAERNINKLVPLNDTQAKQIAWVRQQIWDLYFDLKEYKTDPGLQTPEFQEEIRQRFREVCHTHSTYEELNGQLERMLANEKELLRVLDDPCLPLHNNLSESDIREYVKKRKISGSTRSDEGRRCRDTFTSLKKTCRKLGISFLQYLRDRISRSNRIPPLAETIRAVASQQKPKAEARGPP